MKTFSIEVNGKTYTGHTDEAGNVQQIFGSGQRVSLTGKIGRAVIAALKAAR